VILGGGDREPRRCWPRRPRLPHGDPGGPRPGPAADAGPRAATPPARRLGVPFADGSPPSAPRGHRGLHGPAAAQTEELVALTGRSRWCSRWSTTRGPPRSRRTRSSRRARSVLG
jgi:hypothetical protein